MSGVAFSMAFIVKLGSYFGARGFASPAALILKLLLWTPPIRDLGFFGASAPDVVVQGGGAGAKRVARCCAAQAFSSC